MEVEEGDVVDIDQGRLFVGPVRLFKLRRKNIKWWLGTDALTLYMYPPGARLWHVRIFFRRLIWKVLKGWFVEHWIHSGSSRDFLRYAGFDNTKIKQVTHQPPKQLCLVEKQSHKRFNILVYIPRGGRNQAYKDWIYGAEEIEYLRRHVTGAVWFYVDGTCDMRKVYPFMDCLVKVRRLYDADSRMDLECRAIGIPIVKVHAYKSNGIEVAYKEIEELICQMKS